MTKTWLAKKNSDKAHAVMCASNHGRQVTFCCGIEMQYSVNMVGRGQGKCKMCLKKMKKARQ